MIGPKRSEILYSRVTKQNKIYVQKLAKKEDVSEAAIVDDIIEKHRESNDRTRKKPRASN